MRRLNIRKICAGIVALCGLLAFTGSTFSQPMMIRPFPPGVGNGGMNLPIMQSDSAGNQWMIYDGGWCQENGNNPLYGQAAMLTINNVGVSSNNIAKTDPKTGEVIFENMPCGSFQITRRVLISNATDYVRYVDIIKNTQGQDQQCAYQLQTNLNEGVTSSTVVHDPKHASNQIGWLALTGSNRAATEMFAGKGSKVTPTINYQQGNNMMQAIYQLDIPAGKSVALVYFVTKSAAIDQGQQFITGFKEQKVMQSLPPEIRHIVVNFPASNAYIGDLEILRGDAFDVVELRTGDQMKGNLKPDSYKLTTFYGAIEIPKDQVVGIINVGSFRPRQLVITVDGQIFGGHLDSQTVGLELSSGQVTQIPLTQITRIGYRKRSAEPEEWTFDKPMVLMRSGDRVNVEMPTDPIDISTRYGPMKLDPTSIASIAFQSEDSGVHEISLTDGSKFAGLVNASEFDMKLSGGVSSQVVKFPAGSILRLQLSAKVTDIDDQTPTITLANDDLMVGTVVGQLKLDTAFDTLAVNGPEVRKIAHLTPGSADIQVTLWDNTTVSGQIEQPDIQCKLSSGATVNVPLALLTEYDQPLPSPSAPIVEKIKTEVANLGADDWKERDRAQASLISMGPSVMAVIKNMRDAQSPEAQQRIDAIVKELSKQVGKKSEPVSGPPQPVIMPMDRFNKG
jgi:hypothetical protein